MKLGQIRKQNKVMAAIFEGNLARPIQNYRVIDLINKAEKESVELTEIAASLAEKEFEVAEK